MTNGFKNDRNSKTDFKTMADRDYASFAQMSTNPQVMQYFPKLLNRTESDAFIDKVKAIIELNRLGLLGS
jgi:hypothetical protein